MRFLLLAAAVLVFAPWPAPPLQAAPRGDEAQFRFLRGNTFYRQGRFEDALGEYYLSDRLVPNRNVQFNIARCLEKLRRFNEAFRAWSALESEELPQDERTIIQQSIERLRPQLALFHVTSDPPGAEIYLERKDLGAMGLTPKLIAVPEGTATVLLELPGFRLHAAAVKPELGTEKTISVVLERIHGRARLSGLPPTAVVRRGGRSGEVLRTGPGEVTLPPGPHTLVVSAPGYEEVRAEVEIRADAVVPLELSLRKTLRGSIIVRANVEGALVRVDAREVGFTPLVIEGVTLGRREVEAEKEGHSRARARVDVDAAGPAYVDLRLRRTESQVTGPTKELVAAAQAPASITVITAEEIAAFGYATLADALAGVRGAFSSDDRIYSSVGFRGVSPPGDYTSRVLVLLDGHPINDVLTGQGFVGRGFDVDLANVERIEVARGPGAVLHGTGALFGVINVVTRRPGPGAHASLGLQTATLGLVSGRVSASARHDQAEIGASAAAMSQIGDRRFAWAAGTGPGIPIARKADAEGARHADLQARVGPVRLRAAFNRREKNVPTGAFGTRPEPGTRYLDERLFVEIGAATSLGGAQLLARAAYDQSRFVGSYHPLTGDDEPPLPSTAFGDRFRARWFTGEVRLDFPERWRQNLRIGAEVQAHVELDLGPVARPVQNAASGDRELVLSGHLVDVWTISARLRVWGGIRADRYQNGFGTTFNPKVAVLAEPYAGGNTKLLGGRAFRAPSAYERFYSDGGVTQRPAGALVPEDVTSVEIEHTHLLGRELSLSGSLFAVRLEDLIVLEAESDGILRYRNSPHGVRSLGGDGEFRWEPQPGAFLAASASWQDVRRQDDRGARFTNAPELVAALRGLYPLVPERLRVGSELTLDVGRRTRSNERLDDALIWNVTLSGAYAPWRLRYFAGLFNLLDVREHRTGYPVGPEVPLLAVPRYGRSARVALQLAF